MKKNILKALGILILLTGSLSFSALSDSSSDADSSYDAELAYLCSQFTSHPPELRFEEHFNEFFREAISESTLKSIFASIHSELGDCERTEFGPTDPSGARMAYLVSASGFRARIRFALSRNLVNQRFEISGLWFFEVEDPSIQISDWSDVEAVFKRLDPVGSLSAAFVDLERGQEKGIRPRERQALGSFFKVYILGTLAEKVSRGELDWSDPLPLHSGWLSDSDPTWIGATPPSLKKWASEMISKSDNTATDHLLYFLGRDEVASRFGPMGNHQGAANEPLLSTMEFFKLKLAVTPEVTSRYISGESHERRRIVDSLASIPRQEVFSNASAWQTPIHIREIEWFASAEDACAAMKWLRDLSLKQGKPADSTPLEILGINPGLADISPGGPWAYVGYKGGSEPGVLTMTHLLKTRSGKWGCLSMMWNNETRALEAARFYDLVRKTLAWSARSLE